MVKSAPIRLFGTDGVRGRANQYPMTSEVAVALGRAVAHVLKVRKGNPSVVIGKDTRISGYMIENALASGFASMGVNVLLVGPIPTAAISYLTPSMRCGAGVMISASHNSYEDNGIKFFSANGQKLPDSVESEIEAIVFSEELKAMRLTHDQIGRMKRIDDASGRYIEFVKNTFPKTLSLSGMKIALDLANGATYKVAPTAFFELGAEVVATADRPNGININDHCGTTSINNLKSTVDKNHCDIGIAFDGDGDRVVMVDGNGVVYDGDHLLAIAARDLVGRGCLKGGKVVSTVMANLGLEKYIETLGCGFIRTAVGDRHVLKEMVDHGYNLGGEQSGHIIFSDYLSAGDGILSALQILSVLKRENNDLSQYRNIITLYPQVTHNIPVVSQPLLSEIKGLHEAITHVQHALGQKGRVLVRHSGTELKTRVMVEGEDLKTIQVHVDEISSVIMKSIGTSSSNGERKP